MGKGFTTLQEDRLASRTRGVKVYAIGQHPYYAPYGCAYAVSNPRDNGSCDDYLICSEGVGTKLNADRDDNLARDIREQYYAKCDTGECKTVDLADFVRVFGDRLEANFRLWYRELTRRS